MITFKNENTNSAKNFNSVIVNGVKFYFSYETCVAVELRDTFNEKSFYTIQNYRWPTTGKHLSQIDGWYKNGRLSREDFNTVLREAYRQMNIK